MARSFHAAPATGGAVQIEDGVDLPILVSPVYSAVDVPADWAKDSPSLARHLQKMQEVIIADLAKQGWEYDGGPFRFQYTNPGTGFIVDRYMHQGGFGVMRTGLAYQSTGKAVRVIYGEDGRPVAGETVRYVLGARYRRRAWRNQIWVPETTL